MYLTGTAEPERGSGLVLFHAWWGLDDDVLALADRLSANGFLVGAPDLVHGQVATTIEEAESLSSGADEEHGDAVALAAIDDVAGRIGPGGRVGTVGFSFGVPWTIWSAAEREVVGASVVYYGTILGGSLARSQVPVLGHFASDDPFEPDEGLNAFEEALRSAGRSVTIHRYPSTGHWFAEPSREAYNRDASELAFSRTVDFLGSALSAD